MLVPSCSFELWRLTNFWNNLLCRLFKRMRCRLYGHARCFHTTLFDFCLTVKGSPMFEGLLQPLHLLLIVGIALLCFRPREFADFGTASGMALELEVSPKTE